MIPITQFTVARDQCRFCVKPLGGARHCHRCGMWQVSEAAVIRYGRECGLRGAALQQLRQASEADCVAVLNKLITR
jgi:hypothetical protein